MMITLPLHNAQGEEIGQVELDEADFGGVVRPVLMRRAVDMYESRARVGSRGGRTRGQVSGTTRKMYRQKGTGHARMGSSRTVLRRGGGIAFGLKSGGYGYSIPRRARHAALNSALLVRMLDGEVVLLDDFALDAPRTKAVAELLKALRIDASCLWVLDEHNSTLWLSARNIAGLSMLPATDLNAYEVLKPSRLLIMKSALDRLAAGKS